jgi:autophagy-related protein 11
VFNQYYVDGDIHEVMKLLHFQPQLQPPVEGPSLLGTSCTRRVNVSTESTTTTPRREPSELAASYLRAAQVHQQLIDRTLNSLQYQQSALRIASSALDLHLLDVTNVFNSVAAGTRQELEKQASLIAGVDTDIELISRVPIHHDFLSPAAQKATNAGDPARTLGYYISSERIRRAVSVCQKTHGTRALDRLHRYSSPRR